jgi:hypothetical protein
MTKRCSRLIEDDEDKFREGWTEFVKTRNQRDLLRSAHS